WRSVLRALADWLPIPKARSPVVVLVPPGDLPSRRQSRCNTARHHHSRLCKDSVHWYRGRPNTVHVACVRSDRSGGVLPEDPGQRVSPPRFVPLPVQGITLHHSSVLFVCGPVNIACMMIADEDAALFGGAHRALTFLKPAVDQQGRYRTSCPNIGASIERVAQDVADQALRRNLPNQRRSLDRVGR